MRLTMAFALPPLKKGDRGGFFSARSENPPFPPFAKGGNPAESLSNLFNEFLIQDTSSQMG